MGGRFTQAGGTPASNVAKWNGTTWSALGTGVNKDVYALAVSGSDVYVGGDFRTAGGVSANSLAKWNGTAWSALGTGFGGSLVDYVEVLAVSGTDVYVGGYFSQAGGASVSNVAKWDGTAWSALGAGISSPVGSNFAPAVSALVISGSDVYVGGTFTLAGGLPVNNIAKWDGAAWNALGAGVSNSVTALAISGNDVYAGSAGPFIGRVFKWDGTSWSTLGTSLNNIVSALAVAPGNKLYAGGMFTALNDNSKVMAYFGIYDPARPTSTTSPNVTATATFTLAPNPARRAVQVAGVPARATVEVFDALGRRVATAPADAAGRATLALPAGLAPGVYVVRAGSQAQRLVVE